MIRLEHVRKVYPNVTPLSDVNAEINAGDVISVIGPSGTGKSTLLRCVRRDNESALQHLQDTPENGNGIPAV